MISPDRRIARATELALEQEDRFSSFKQKFDLDSTDTNVIVEFFKNDPFEAQQAYLIMNHLARAYAETKTETPK